MRLIEFANSNLSRRPARTILTIVGIALAIGTAVALLALGRGITESLSQGFDERGAELLVAPRNMIDVTAMRLPEEMGISLAAMDGVAEARGELFAFTSTDEGQHVLVAGWPAGVSDWQRIPIEAGRLPAPEAREVLLGDVIAQTLGAAVGKTVSLFDEEYLVTGITGYDTAMNRGMAITHLSVLQEAAFREGQVSYFSVRLEPGLGREGTDAVRRAIAESLPVVVSDMQELADQLQSDRNIAILQSVSTAISVVAIVMGALNLLATLLLSVQERTREIGMLASIGWSDGQVIALVMLEGLSIGLAGCAGGVVVGLAASSLFGAIPAIGDIIAFTPRLSDMLMPLLFAIPLCAVGSAYPAWRAVRMLPAQALRQT